MRIFLFLIVLITACFAHAQDTLTIDRLDYRFVSFEDGQMEPIISLEDADVAGVFVPCERDVHVEVCGPNPFDIWIDGRLILQKKEGECEYLKMESLCEIAERDTVYISVVSRETLKGIRARTFVLKPSKKSAFEIMRRTKVSQIVYFGFVGCFLALVILRTNFLKGKITLRKPNIQSYSGKFFSIESLIMQLVIIMVSSFSASIYENNSSLIDWIAISGYVLFYWSILITITWSSAAVFRFNRLANWQLVFTIKYWLFLTLFVFIVQFLGQIFNATSVGQSVVLIYLIVIGLLVFMSTVIYIFMSQRGMKSLHIFIYLCTTEILPIGLIVYWLLE